jgi:hypothetical protein
MQILPIFSLIFVANKGGVSDKIAPFEENSMNKTTQTELEAAAFRRLIAHLQTQTEVQNIDLMILADFCRNCLAKWVVSAASEKNIDMDYEKAREFIYGMPYSQWKESFQTKATPEQLAAFNEKRAQKTDQT